MKRAGKAEKIFYVVIGIILAVAISLLMSVSAQSRSRESVLFDNRNYEAAQEAYRQQVQQVLESYDCYNSGLTMTRIVSLDGEREYQLQIHNRKIQKLTPDVYENLCGDVAACKIVLLDGTEYSVQVSYE